MQEIDKQIHSGRRERLRGRFMRDGLSSFSESEVLEFALGFCIPRMDTNPTAHRLLNKFGTLKNVLNATPSVLCNIEGIGENTSVFLTFLKPLTKYLAVQNMKHAKIQSMQDALDYFIPLMETFTAEEFILLCLSKNGTILLMESWTSNEKNKVTLNMRQLVEKLMRVNTASAIVAHNHLGDDPKPSNSDIILTRQLVRGCLALDIEPVDHIIIAGDKYYSFAESGLIPAFKAEYAQMLAAPILLPEQPFKLNHIPVD